MSEHTWTDSGPVEPAPSDSASTTPPVTGHQVIDATLAELVGVEELPAAEQHDRLAAALDVLSSVLESSRDQAQAPIPGVR